MKMKVKMRYLTTERLPRTQESGIRAKGQATDKKSDTNSLVADGERG